MSKFSREVTAVALKEFLGEIHSPAFFISQIALVAIFISAAFVVYRVRTQDINVVATIFWLIFYAVSCGNQLNAFSAEKESGTSGFWRQIFLPMSYICGKMFYNVIKNYCFCIVIVTASFGLFYSGDFGADVIFGFTAISAVAFGACMTFPAVLCAGAAGKNGLFPFITFPVVLPAIISANDILCSLVAGKTFLFAETVFLFAYSGVIAGVSLMLFSVISRYPEE